MIIPCMLYKTRETYKVVHTEEEYIQARAEGWHNHWQPEFWDSKPQAEKIADAEEAEAEEDTRVIEIPNDMMEEDEEKNLEDLFTEATGKNALCDRGPYKGQETKQFLKWKKDNGYS